VVATITNADLCISNNSICAIRLWQRKSLSSVSVSIQQKPWTYKAKPFSSLSGVIDAKVYFSLNVLQWLDLDQGSGIAFCT
ncbi:hypothetical protein ABVT39_004577, partial [Epinephelus coioides]